MTTECSRAWQAEAVEDGRLSRADTESFQRHAATCESCTREIRALETLRSVGKRLPILVATPLEQRRLRQSLLRAANDLALHPRRPRPTAALALGAFAAVVVVLLVAWLSVPRDHRPAVVATAPTFQIEPSEGAAWSSLSRQATVRLSLKSGRFEISVDKLSAGQRFLLELPDGELEVKGTRFIVEVHDAKTQRVDVHEGRVALRLRGESALLLAAGDTWPAVTASASSARQPATVPAGKVTRKPAASASATESRTVRARVPAAPALTASATASVPQTSAADPTAPSGDTFAQAMAAFAAGDFGKAERLFTAFELAHPADARVEDATYLRAVARARRGDAGAASAIARDYLRRYPNGLRRTEAERLLR